MLIARVVVSLVQRRSTSEPLDCVVERVDTSYQTTSVAFGASGRMLKWVS